MNKHNSTRTSKLNFSFKFTVENKENGITTSEQIYKSEGEVSTQSVAESISEILRQVAVKTLRSTADGISGESDPEPETEPESEQTQEPADQQFTDPE